MICPACGGELTDDHVCAEGEAHSEGWDPINEDMATKTAYQWFADLGETVIADNITDPERKYTQEDFKRRFLGRGGSYDES